MCHTICFTQEKGSHNSVYHHIICIITQEKVSHNYMYHHTICFTQHVSHTMLHTKFFTQEKVSHKLYVSSQYVSSYKKRVYTTISIITQYVSSHKKKFYTTISILPYYVSSHKKKFHTTICFITQQYVSSRIMYNHTKKNVLCCLCDDTYWFPVRRRFTHVRKRVSFD